MSRLSNILMTLLMINEIIASSPAAPSPPQPTTTTTSQALNTTIAPTTLQGESNSVVPTSLSTGPSLEKPLYLFEVNAEQFDPYYTIRCPIDKIAPLKPKFESVPDKKNPFRIKLNSYITVTWEKDGRPFRSRINGNRFDRSNNNLFLYQFGPSDQGTYTCKLNYSRVPPDLWNKFTFHESGSFKVLIMTDLYLPNTKPTITHPPAQFYVARGENVTFTCNRPDTLSTQHTVWFKSCPFKNDSSEWCAGFMDSFNQALLQDSYVPLDRYLLANHSADSLEVHNVTDENTGHYGCAVYNLHGVDIRLGKVDLAYNWAKFQHDLRVESVRLGSNQKSEWIWVTIGFAGFLAVAVTIMGCIYIFKLSIQSDKKQVAPLLAKANGGHDCSSKKMDLRQRLPTIEAPDIYNTGKSIDGFITGHFHQEAGHIMAQSICSNLLNKTNPSISSSTSHQSDEAFWGKSLCSNNEACRVIYPQSSNSTATTVPLYDHPPSTGTLRHARAIVDNSCVSNPIYWLLNPDNDAAEWNFPRRNLDRLDKIGEGQFGEVWRYIARSKDGTGSIVAVKKLKDDLCATDSERSELRAEIEIMKSVNRHPNVIKLLHYCIDECGPILLIMEYAENGKLQTYLRNCRASHKSYNDYNGRPMSRQSITSKELIKFTYHIAKGMEYVASQGIVHRDLASRNILVSKDKICKVADFGFARRVDDEFVYVRKSTNPVPVKWMAPEALEGNKFTSKSDVFSLGILMWEIVTLGATPYEQLTSEGVYKKVTTGGRLDRPPHCKDEFYALMAQCWTHDPALRPTFKEVAQQLEKLLLSENDYIELDQYPEHAYYNIVNAAEKEIVQLST